MNILENNIDDNEYRFRNDIVFSKSINNFDEFLLEFGTGFERSSLLFNQEKVIYWIIKNKVVGNKEFFLRDASQEFGGSTIDVEPLIDLLINEGLLITKESTVDSSYPFEKLWNKYGWSDAAKFHRSIRDIKFADGTIEGFNEQCDVISKFLDNAEIGDDIPQPKIYKEYKNTSNDIKLSDFLKSDDKLTEVQKTFLKRRTFREFNNKPIPFEKFSDLIGFTCGEIGTLDFGKLGLHLLKTSPSGGSRHPIEGYVVVNSVENIASGIYHYNVEKHSLNCIKLGDFSDTIYNFAHKQNGALNASAVFIFSARWDRHMWKYRYARSYRMVLFDCAHMVQSLLILATDLGLKTFITPAIKDSEIEELLEINDPFQESALYLISVGT